MRAPNWLFPVGFSLIAASGCIISDPGVTYILPSKDAGTPNVRDGAGGTRNNIGGTAGAGGTGGWAGSTEAGGAGGLGIGGIAGNGVGGAGTIAGNGGTGGVSGAAGASRDAGGAGGAANGNADARTDAVGDGDAGIADVNSDASDGSGGGADSDGSGGTGGTGGGATGGGPGTGGKGGGSTGGGPGTGGTGGGTGGGPGTGGTGSGTGSGGTGGVGGTGGTGGSGVDASADARLDAMPDGGTGTIVEFTIPTPNAGAYDIALGGDGNVWFTEETGNKIGRITTEGVITDYALPTANAKPRGLTASGTRIYFTEFAVNKIGYFDTSDPLTITEVASLTGPTGMLANSDGTVWYTAVTANEIVRLAADGKAAGHWPTPHGVGGAISFYDQYRFYLTTTQQTQIDILNPTTNGLSSMPIPDDGLGQLVSDIQADWQTVIWFTDGAVLRSYDQDQGAYMFYDAPSPMRSIAVGPLGTSANANLYITMPFANGILVRSGGALTTYAVPTANATPHDIVVGADKNLWFTEKTGNKIGRMAR